MGFSLPIMGRIGITIKYINMVKIIFPKVEASIKLNGITTRSFEIKKGVWQGCPLEPYLFFII
jgi:hypothetical protein